MAVLSVQPHLLSKSISNLSSLKSWEPVATSEYLGIMRYLSQLLRAAGVDAKSKAQLRAAFAPAPAADESSDKQSQQAIINALIHSWIPPGIILFFVVVFNIFSYIFAIFIWWQA